MLNYIFYDIYIEITCNFTASNKLIIKKGAATHNIGKKKNENSKKIKISNTNSNLHFCC